eukprot:5432001-Prymnesium_polylepis.3
MKNHVRYGDDTHESTTKVARAAGGRHAKGIWHGRNPIAPSQMIPNLWGGGYAPGATQKYMRGPSAPFHFRSHAGNIHMTTSVGIVPHRTSVAVTHISCWVGPTTHSFMSGPSLP